MSNHAKIGVKWHDVITQILTEQPKRFQAIYVNVCAGELREFIEEYNKAMGIGQPCTDPIVENNVNLLRERSTVGVEKYGTTLADNKLTHKQWLRHALEELLDGANYLQAALQQDDGKLVTHGVLKDKTPRELMEYSPGLTVLQAEQLAHNYRINWAGRMWRFDGGKIVYSD